MRFHLDRILAAIGIGLYLLLLAWIVLPHFL